MKFKKFLQQSKGRDGFYPTMTLRWAIRKNTRKTAREEAIAAKIIEQANPRENVTGHFPWGPEEQTVLQQLWYHDARDVGQWRDVLVEGAELICTEQDGLPVPNAVKEPGIVIGNFPERMKELLGEDF
jgi:hypothetical protein